MFYCTLLSTLYYNVINTTFVTGDIAECGTCFASIVKNQKNYCVGHFVNRILRTVIYNYNCIMYLIIFQ